MSTDRRAFRSSAARDRGFILTLTLILVFTIVVIGSVVGLVALRNALMVKSGENVIFDSAATPIAFGRAKTFDLCEAPQLVCKDPDNGLLPIVGVRPDRFTSRNQVFYTGAGCTGDVYLAPPAVPAPGSPGFWQPELPVGYLNGALLEDSTLARVAYGVGAPAGFSFAIQSPTGPGRLYRSTGVAPASQLVASVWTSLAPDCAPRDGSELLEAGRVTAGGTAVTVYLRNEYVSPVVVTTPQYVNNTTPMVTRVSNVTSTSFDVRLQSPSAAAVVPDLIHYLVVEAGSWTIDGFVIDAQVYTSTVTDNSSSWVGQAQTYGPAFTNPVVIGQVMSENDPAWSVFWSRGVDAVTPPDSANLYTGKHVGQDGTTTRANELIGFIVFEMGHGILAGQEFEAALGPDTVQSSIAPDTPPYSYLFATTFASAPPTVVASQAAMDGGDGSWAQLFGSPAASRTALSLTVEEDQIADVDGHTNEQVAYAAFAPFGLCTNIVENYTLVAAEPVEASVGVNVLEQYTAPFYIEPSTLGYSPAAAENAPLQTPTIFTPGSPAAFPDPDAENAAPLAEDAPGASGLGDPVTQPDAGPEDDPPPP